MSQHLKLISTASESLEDDESDYAVQPAQDRRKRKIFQRKLLMCFCASLLTFFMVAGIVVGILLGATDLLTADNGKATAGNVIPTPNTTTHGTTTSTAGAIAPTPTPSATPSPTPSPLPPNIANSKVLDYIDTNYDPCEDFYNYSCGNWHSTHPNASEWGTFNELALDNYNKLAGYLSQRPNSGDPDAIKKAKYIYSACTDTDYIHDNLDDELQDFMVNKAGGWDNGGFWGFSSWSINSSLYKDHYLGSSAFFRFGIFPDDLNSSKQVIRVIQNI